MMEMIAAHRRALADALSELAPSQWRADSLCAGWTPAHVLAHLTMPFRISGEEFMAGLQRSGGDFTRFSDEVAARDSQLPPADLVAVLRDNADNPWSPPGGGLVGALSHDVIHGLDIAWPQSLVYDIAAGAMVTVLSSVTSPLELEADDAIAHEVHTAASGETLFGFPLSGIRVTATDLGWSAGQGAQLAGRGRDLLPLLASRRIPRELFHGDGVAVVWPVAAR
jgi:uncharacterized protein (TIGR03083 family)